MKHMIKHVIKHVILFVFALCTALTARASTALVVTFNDGSRQTFALASLPDIRMANDTMTITTTETRVEVDLWKVRTFTIGETPTAISNTIVPGMQRKGETILIPSTKAEVRAYTLDGRAVAIDVSHNDGTTIVSLSSLPKGQVYIIRAAGKTMKISR